MDIQLFSFPDFFCSIILSSIVLLSRKKKSTLFLALFLLAVAADCLFLSLSATGKFTAPAFYKAWHFFNFLAAPALFFYVLFVFNEERRLKWYDAFHLAPALMNFTDYPAFYMGNAGNTVRHAIALCYIALLIILSKHQKNAGDHESMPSKKVVDWIKLLLLFFTLYTITSLAVLMLPQPPIAFAAYIFLFVPLVILFFKPHILYSYSSLPWSKTASKKLQLPLDSVAMEEVQGAMNEFEAQHRYLEKNLKLPDLAMKLGIRPYILSYYINNVYNRNFNDFINWRRVQYVIHGMKEKKWPRYTLEGIADEAGFSNRITFLTAFKKFTGVTPTAFLNQFHGTEPGKKKEDGDDFIRKALR